jgi:hypothetical protein
MSWTKGSEGAYLLLRGILELIGHWYSLLAQHRETSCGF